jgi:hypothetical protein
MSLRASLRAPSSAKGCSRIFMGTFQRVQDLVWDQVLGATAPWPCCGRTMCVWARPFASVQGPEPCSHRAASPLHDCLASATGQATQCHCA